VSNFFGLKGGKGTSTTSSTTPGGRVDLLLDQAALEGVIAMHNQIYADATVYLLEM